MNLLFQCLTVENNNYQLIIPMHHQMQTKQYMNLLLNNELTVPNHCQKAYTIVNNEPIVPMHHQRQTHYQSLTNLL